MLEAQDMNNRRLAYVDLQNDCWCINSHPYNVSYTSIPLIFPPDSTSVLSQPSRSHGGSHTTAAPTLQTLVGIESVLS